MWSFFSSFMYVINSLADHSNYWIIQLKIYAYFEILLKEIKKKKK